MSQTLSHTHHLVASSRNGAPLPHPISRRWADGFHMVHIPCVCGREAYLLVELEQDGPFGS